MVWNFIHKAIKKQKNYMEYYQKSKIFFNSFFTKQEYFSSVPSLFQATYGKISKIRIGRKCECPLSNPKMSVLS